MIQQSAKSLTGKKTKSLDKLLAAVTHVDFSEVVQDVQTEALAVPPLVLFWVHFCVLVSLNVY